MNASCHLNPTKGIWAGQQALSRGLYTNVTECSCFSVCADKLFKVPGMAAIVPSSTLPPLFPVLCLLRFHDSHKYKSERMQSVFLRCCVCLISLGPVLCCRPTCRRLYCRENNGELRCRTTSDGNLLLLPPFNRFASLILPSFPPLVHFFSPQVFISGCSGVSNAVCAMAD